MTNFGREGLNVGRVLVDLSNGSDRDSRDAPAADDVRLEPPRRQVIESRPLVAPCHGIDNGIAMKCGCKFLLANDVRNLVV